MSTGGLRVHSGGSTLPSVGSSLTSTVWPGAGQVMLESATVQPAVPGLRRSGGGGEAVGGGEG
jgi:hypothetical protein